MRLKQWILVGAILLQSTPGIPQNSINEKKKIIEMVSVGQDGHLWVMAGPLGEEVRCSQKYKTQNGGEAQLRFTRFNVSSDRFESRMEHTNDGGKSWKPGNHQVFRRKQ